MGHCPCAWCWLLGVDKYLCLPRPDLHGVCVYSLENFKMNLPVSSWGLKTGPGYYVSGGGGMSMLEHPGGFVNVMRITDEYVRMNVCSELQAGPSGE